MIERSVTVIAVPPQDWEDLKEQVSSMSSALNMLVDKEHKNLLTVKEALEMLKIGRSTFERYVQSGLLEKVQLTKGGKVLVKLSEVEKLMTDVPD